MNSRNTVANRWIAVAALTMVGVTTASAQTAADTSRNRAEVVRETLAARAAGTLVPAGQGALLQDGGGRSGSAATRGEIASQVIAARQAGALVPAGEGVMQAPTEVYAGSLVARSTVKSGVIEARRSGQLVPAGEGPDSQLQARSERAAEWLTRNGRGANTLARR